MILPDLNYTLDREKHTHIENLKPLSRNYRNYRVKTNAYIENLNCWESLQKKLQKLQGENKPTPLNSLILPDLNYTLHRENHTHIENLKLPSGNYRNYRVKKNAFFENLNCWESLQQKLQKLQGEKEHTSLNSLIFFDSDYTLHSENTDI